MILYDPLLRNVSNAPQLHTLCAKTVQRGREQEAGKVTVQQLLTTGFLVCQVFYVDIFNLLSYCLSFFFFVICCTLLTHCAWFDPVSEVLLHIRTACYFSHTIIFTGLTQSVCISKTGGAPLYKDPCFNSVSAVYTHDHTLGSKSTQEEFVLTPEI